MAVITLPPPVPVAAFPNVPIALGIPVMNRPTGAIQAALNGVNGLNAVLADTATVTSIIGGLSNASTLIRNVPGAQSLLSASTTAQMLLYRVPGVPQLLAQTAAVQQLLTSTAGLSSLLSNVTPVQRLVSPGASAGPSTGQPTWGIFDSSNVAVVVPDSVIKFEFLKDYKVMDYPVEAGSFATYNKVEQPFTARMVLAKGGALADVTTFLSVLQSIAADINLYNIVTPQAVYKKVNVDHIDWTQEASHGVYLLQASVWLQQIIDVPLTPSQNNTQQPSGADRVADGGVQAQTPTLLAQAAATSFLSQFSVPA